LAKIAIPEFPAVIKGEPHTIPDIIRIDKDHSLWYRMHQSSRLAKERRQPMALKKIGFLASGRGSNMQAVIDAIKANKLDAVPCVVISNNSASGAMERARNEGIPSYHLSSKTHPIPEELDLAIMNALLAHDVELVMLAGYMKKIGANTLSRYRNRILNSHPALLPKFGGDGMYGSRVHEAVLAAGETETGVSIHIVNEEYDTGPLVAQTRMPVLKDDTVESLSKRVLSREHSFLVETLQGIVSGALILPQA
jgi:phosphoribosylglycinamide formyltransferase-1